MQGGAVSAKAGPAARPSRAWTSQVGGRSQSSPRAWDRQRARRWPRAVRHRDGSVLSSPARARLDFRPSARRGAPLVDGGNPTRSRAQLIHGRGSEPVGRRARVGGIDGYGCGHESLQRIDGSGAIYNSRVGYNQPLLTTPGPPQCRSVVSPRSLRPSSQWFGSTGGSGSTRSTKCVCAGFRYSTMARSCWRSRSVRMRATSTLKA